MSWMSGMEQLFEEQRKTNEKLDILVFTTKKLLERYDSVAELQLDRLNHMEWRSAIEFESKWSKIPMTSAFKLWKMGAMKSPSRIGNDREGYAGSPFSHSDEQEANEHMPDELVWSLMEDMKEHIRAETPGSIERAKAYRSKWLAKGALKEAEAKAKAAEEHYEEVTKKKLCMGRARVGGGNELQPVEEGEEEAEEGTSEQQPTELPPPNEELQSTMSSGTTSEDFTRVEQP